jgi:hypothetical protein
MDDELRLEHASGSDSSLAQRNAADPIALHLDGGAALVANRTGHSGAEKQLSICGVDDRIERAIGQVA